RLQGDWSSDVCSSDLTRQADLRKHFEGSVAGLVETADHADQRKPPEHGRSARAPVPDEADRKVLLRRRRGYCAGLRAAVGLTSRSEERRVGKESVDRW